MNDMDILLSSSPTPTLVEIPRLDPAVTRRPKRIPDDPLSPESLPKREVRDHSAAHCWLVGYTGYIKKPTGIRLGRLVTAGSRRGISTNVGVGLDDNNISISFMEGDVGRADDDVGRADGDDGGVVSTSYVLTKEYCGIAARENISRQNDIPYRVPQELSGVTVSITNRETQCQILWRVGVTHDARRDLWYLYRAFGS
ncbi:hypothetical protein BDR04DRAFT_1120845 [Suillus decipiens]|nr:hypothetical protein BDR04DRAFT_1120845 [Suillus decipiens]